MADVEEKQEAPRESGNQAESRNNNKERPGRTRTVRFVLLALLVVAVVVFVINLLSGRRGTA